MKRCVLHGLYKESKCPKCNANANKTYDKHKRDKSLAKFYSSAKWKKVRNAYIKAHPLCEKCGYKADVVDHIVEIRDGGDKYSFKNLQSLCHSCHNAKTTAEKRKRGGANKSLNPSRTPTEPHTKFLESPFGGGRGK